ncbi:MAG: site-specific DNA-methyltransferase [Syntrophobacteraceae bacterium]
MDEPEKFDLRSHDIADDKKEELLRLFPETRTEGGKIDFERLKLALGETVDVRKERYGMNWPGKADCFKTIQSSSLGTLRPCPEESVAWDTTENLIIEGDNLEVLKLLQKSYLGKVKMIYIDPPYNTGNDFIYPDNYTESLQTYLEYTGQVDAEGKKFGTNTDTDGRFHSKWLNMMYPRLYLARDLLREDGVIFISIDDHEVENLRRLCNEVFGEENFVAQLVWEKGRKNDAKLFSVGHEYIVVYANSLMRIKELQSIWREEKPGAKEIWDKYCKLKESLGENYSEIEAALQAWFSSLSEKHPSKKLTRYRRVDKYGPWRDRDISWPGGGGPTYDVPHPRTGKPCKVPERGWIFSNPDDMQARIKAGVVVFRDDHTEPPFMKAHLKPIHSELLNGEYANEEEEELALQVRGSYFYKQSQVAVKYLKNLMGAKVFDNPKDHVELARLMKYIGCSQGGDIILDFFAGSGSTAEAVLEVNKERDTQVSFILVQLPELLDPDNKDQKAAHDFCKKHSLPVTIAELTKERVRRAIQRLNEPEGGQLSLWPKQKQDRGFRVFKLAESNFRPWNTDIPTGDLASLEKQLEMFIEHIRKDRSAEDILYEILLKSGFPLTAPVEKLNLAGKNVYRAAGGALFICLERRLTLELIRAMAELKPERVVCLDRGFAGNDQLKANAVQIFRTKGVTSFRTV